MIVYSIIQKSQLEGAQRIDPEYYQPEYLEKEKKLHRVSTIRIGDIGFVTDGEHGSPIWDEMSGIRYFSSQYVEEGYLNSENAHFINKIINERNKRTQLKKGDILLSIVGRIGIVGLVDIEDLPANTDRNVATIKITDHSYLPEFIVVFLNSKYGKFQTFREVAGNVQPIIILSKVRDILVPKISVETQEVISSIFQESINQLKNSKVFYREAEDLLLEELGLKNFQVEDDLSFVVNLSDVKSANRVDAEHFQLKYNKLLEKIRQKGAQVLTDIIKNVTAKFDPLKTPDGTFRYVELANINSSIGVIDGYSEVLGKEAPSRAKRLLKNGDIIASTIEGSLEKVALVDNTQDGYLASTGFFQFRSDEILPAVLLVLAKSIVMQWQLKKHCAGTILTAVSNESLKKMLVPTIPKVTQQKIAGLVRKSHEARKKSKELLEEAKRKVEETIEKGNKN